MEKEKKESGEFKKIVFPCGLVIPYSKYNQCVRLRIRRANPGKYPKYHIVASSSMHPYRNRYHDENVAIIVESELDAILLCQEIKDDVLIIALGSVIIRPDERLTEILKNFDHILISLDTDEAGNTEYNNFWKKYFPNSRMFNIPEKYGKDHTEAMVNGFDLYKWYRSFF